MPDKSSKNENWTFLTNHSHVLICLAKSASMRIRDIANAVGITERAVMHIIADLDKAGYIDRVKDGRCNVYQTHLDCNLRHPLEAHRKIAGLVSFICEDLDDEDAEEEFID